MALDILEFKKVWADYAGRPSSVELFSTYEPDETKVRDDMQYLFNAIKDYLNETVKGAIDAIDAGSYQPGSVDTAAIQTHAVTREKLAVADAELGISAAVGTDQLDRECVTSIKIAPGEVKEVNIYNGAVTNDKLAGGITNNKLAGGITNDKLAGNISNDKLAGNISNDKLAGNISADKLAGNIPSAKLGNDILPNKVGVLMGTETPVASNPGAGEVLLEEGKIYLKYEA